MKPKPAGARPIWLVGEQGLAAWLEVQPPAVRSWARAQGFAAEKQKLLLIPTASGDGIAGAALGLGPTPDLSEPTLWTSAGLPDRLPPGRYRFAGTFSAVGATQLTLGWEYGSYRFTRYRKTAGRSCRRWWRRPAPTSNTCGSRAKRSSEARDLINTPANDLGPGGARRSRAASRAAARSRVPDHRRRGPAAAELSTHL